MKKNEDMEQPKVAQREDEMSFEIIELEEEMLSNVVGGVPPEISSAAQQAHCA